MASVVRDWWIDPILQISKYAVWQIMSTCSFMVSQSSKLTQRLWQNYKKECQVVQFSEHQEGQRIWKGQRAVPQSYFHSVSFSLLWVVHLFVFFFFFTLLTQFWMLQTRESVIEQWVRLYNSVSLANIWCILCKKECWTMTLDRGCCAGWKELDWVRTMSNAMQQRR